MLIPKKKRKNILEPPLANQHTLTYPKERDFYSITLEEYGGLLPIHSVRMSFVLPYDDWCEFEKSSLYQSFQRYLQELQKRDNLH